MQIDELAYRRNMKRPVGHTKVRKSLEERIPRDPLKPIFHPDQHIIPALRAFDAALLCSLKDSPRAKALAWQAIRHAEICDLPQLIKYAKALLGAL